MSLGNGSRDITNLGKQGLSRFKLDRALSGHLNGLPGAGISCLPWMPFLDFKDPEVADFDAVPAGKRIHQHVKKSLHIPSNVFRIQVETLCEAHSQIMLSHLIDPYIVLPA